MIALALRRGESGDTEMIVQRLVVALVACSVPVVALAGANPLLGATPPPSPASIKKYENLLKGDSDKIPCDERGLAKDGTTNCKPAEPVYMPRDGVTDELLEKYRLRK